MMIMPFIADVLRKCSIILCSDNQLILCILMKCINALLSYVMLTN